MGASHQEKINAILAFSPASGGPMEDCKPDPYFKDIKIPLLMLRPASEMERESSQKQFELAESHGHNVYVAQYGVYGASMLVEKKLGLMLRQTGMWSNYF